MIVSAHPGREEIITSSCAFKLQEAGQSLQLVFGAKIHSNVYLEQI